MNRGLESTDLNDASKWTDFDSQKIPEVSAMSVLDLPDVEMSAGSSDGSQCNQKVGIPHNS